MSHTKSKGATSMHSLRTPVCGHLVKEYDMVRVMADEGYEKLVPGRHRWLLHGQEVTEIEAEAYKVVYQEVGNYGNV